MARLPLANPTNIVVEISVSLLNHLTLIKGGAGDSEERKEGSLSLLGKMFSGEIRGQLG